MKKLVSTAIVLAVCVLVFLLYRPKLEDTSAQLSQVWQETRIIRQKLEQTGSEWLNVAKGASGVDSASHMNAVSRGSAAFKKCILAQKGPNMFDSLSSIVNSCIKMHLTIAKSDFETFHMGRFGELKWFLPFQNQSYNQYACHFLTIGIGGDSQVEKEFHMRYPKCRIFGVEPSPDQYANFSQYGTVIPVGTGPNKGELPMTIRVGTSYKRKTVPIEPLHELLDKNLGTRLVDFVTLDIEGFEYEIMENFRTHWKFDKAGVKFCQIDVEFHTVEWKGKDFHFEDFFEKLMLETDFHPIFAVDFLGLHRKLTMVMPNVKECDDKFALSRFFGQK